LFTITCTTCQARLAVRDEAVIGQILSCPKCGSMVQVTPPPGWSETGRQAPAEESDSTPEPSEMAAPDAPRWSQPAGVVPPPLPNGRPATGPSTSAEAPIDMLDGLSPTEQLWRKRLLWVGLPLAGLIIAAGVLWMVLSDGRPDTTVEDVVQTSPKATPTTEAPEEVELPPAGTLNAQWVPDDARLVVSLAPSRLADRSGIDRLLEAAGPFWQPVIGKVLTGFGLRPGDLRRVTWSTSDLANLAGQSVVVIEVEADYDLGRLAAAGVPTGARFRRAPCRRLTDADWTGPFALVGPRTIVTGEADLLQALGARSEPRLASRPLAKLLDAPSGDPELSVLVDLDAARRAGWRLPERALAVWPEGVEPWQALWRLPEGLGVDLWLDGGAMHSKIGFICPDEPSSEAVLAAVERLVPAGKAALAKKAQALSQQAGDKSAADQLEAYVLLLGEAAAALEATRWEQLDTTVRVWTNWRHDFAGVGRLVLDSVEEIRRDWLAAVGRLIQHQESRLLRGLDAYRRQKSHYPAAAVGGALLPPETRLSWIATLLPDYGHRDWHEQLKFGYPWNGPKNKPVTTRALPEVVNPAFGPATDKDGFPVTHYVGSAGLGPEAAELSADDPRAGVFAFGRKTRPSQIKDGASNTIAILGVGRDPGPWASGGEPTVRGFTRQPYVNGPDGFGTGQPDGMFVGIADGSVRFLSKKIHPRVMEQMVTINGGDPWPAPVADRPKVGPKPAKPTTKGAPDKAKPPVPKDKPPAEIPPEIVAQLRRPIVAVKLEDIKLGDFIHFVQEMSTLEIRFDQAALDRAGVSWDATLTVEQKKTTVGRLLKEGLRQCGLVFVVRDGRLVVTGAEAKGSQ